MSNGFGLTLDQKRWMAAKKKFRQDVFLKKGRDEADLEEIKEEEKSGKRFEEIVGLSDKVIFRTRAIFPFDLFPNQITINVNQVNIIYNELLSRRIHSIAIKNIFDVSVNSGLVFASLKIVDAGYKGESPIEINYLKKADAFEARQIIQGLIVVYKENFDVSKIDIDKFKLEVLGEATGIENE